MKHLFSILLSLLVITAACAAEPPLYTYRGEVAGVMCSACSSHVEAALVRLPGVKSAKVVRDPSGGLPKIHLTSTVSTITRQDAVKALGQQARTYDIRSLEVVPKK